MEQREIIKNSKVMAGVTAISRVFGLFREQLIAYLLGATRWGDVWAVSFMIPNLFRRLIAEGAMSTAFVPLLSEMAEREREAATQQFIRAVFSLILLMATAIVTAIVLILPWALPFLLDLAAAGSGVEPMRADEMFVAPTRLMAPYLIFISLAAVCQGALNVNNRFALPAATPIVLNAVIIVFGLGMRNLAGGPIWGLCVGVLFGGFLQFFLQWLQLRRMGIVVLPTARAWTRRTAEAARLWLPTTFSAGVTQINALVSTFVAVNLASGAAIALTLSNRLMELILGVFAVAVSTALLPALARQRARQDGAAMNASFWSSLELMALIQIPASIGLLLSGPSVIAWLFQRGAFDARGLDLTYTAFVFHAMALLPIAWHRVAFQAFYAHKRTRTAVFMAAAAAVLNIVGCFVLPRFFEEGRRHGGVALATLISSWSLVLMAFFLASRRFGLVWPRRFSLELFKIAFASLAFLPIWLPLSPRVLGLGELTWRTLASAATFGAVAWLLRTSSLRTLLRPH